MIAPGVGAGVGTTVRAASDRARSQANRYLQICHRGPTFLFHCTVPSCAGTVRG
jgi:hypothetical protein